MRILCNPAVVNLTNEEMENKLKEIINPHMKFIEGYFNELVEKVSSLNTYVTMNQYGTKFNENDFEFLVRYSLSNFINQKFNEKFILSHRFLYPINLLNENNIKHTLSISYTKLYRFVKKDDTQRKDLYKKEMKNDLNALCKHLSYIQTKKFEKMSDEDKDSYCKNVTSKVEDLSNRYLFMDSMCIISNNNIKIFNAENYIVNTYPAKINFCIVIYKNGTPWEMKRGNMINYAYMEMLYKLFTKMNNERMKKPKTAFMITAGFIIDS